MGKLVAEEGPVHREYAAQRLADAWGLRRAGSRVIGAVGEAVQICMKKGLIRIVGDFLWPPGLRDVGVRVPVSGEPFSFRRIEYIPPEEIEGAMRLVVHHAMSLSAESLLTETARIFGFDRTGSRITTRLLEIYKRLLEKGELVSHGGIVSLPKSRQ